MEVLIFDKLPKQAYHIRVTVFMNEQGFVDEIDDTDSFATHLLVFDESNPIATCRVFEKDGKYFLGRFAVLKEFRNRGVGRLLLQEAENFVKSRGFSCLYLHAQLRAVEFYKKCGYETFGNIEMEENYPHIWMKKSFS